MSVNHKLDTDSQVFFYEQEFYVLSNFSAFRVIFAGTDYQTAEHAYHAQKFNPAGVLWASIVDARSAHEAFRIAQAHPEQVLPNWLALRVPMMRFILVAKFNQHEYVRRKLRETGDRELVEDSWRDSFWGIGPNGDGQNMLGKLWMELREKLPS